MRVIDHLKKNGCCRMWMGKVIMSHHMPDIQNELLRELNCHSEVVMDFSDAVVVDTACIRTILAMRQEAVRKNQSLRFMSSNKSFLELLELLNKSPLGEALAD